ncbi:Dihydrolipoyllysine-residue acetyltransferase component of acetoin cleaving system [bacterium HR40]|nr:Dihydrolipoyllysine-residue acetyltransferase component of acetoin cleaving system [bacterium HR40]
MRLVCEDRRVHVADWGRGFDPARPTVIFLHGAGMDHSVWAFQARALAFAGHNALAPDLPGHGRSEPHPDFGPTIDERARWLARLADALGLAAYAVVGHSMGGLLGLALAARDPRVRRLALVSTAARMPVHPALLEAARHDLPRAAAMIVDWAFAPARRLGAQAVPGSFAPMWAMRLLLASAPGVLAADLEACDRWRASAEAAARVGAATVALAGSEDRMTPVRACEELAAMLPEGGFERLPGCGHMPMVEAPRALLAALRGFLERR